MAYNLTENQKELAKWINREHLKHSLPETFSVSFLREAKCFFVDGVRHEGQIGQLIVERITPGTFQALEKEGLISLERMQPKTLESLGATHMGLETLRVTIAGRLQHAVSSDFIDNLEITDSKLAIRSGNTAPKKFQTAFDTYEVVQTLGEGGNGMVFTVSKDDKQRFALKCLKPDSAHQSKRKRFKNELYFAMRNPHVNLIEVLDSGIVEWNGQALPFYVMPLHETNLRKVLQLGLPIEKKLTLFSQILDGVEAAHLLGVVHRDLKPENILCDSTGDRAVVADFGIAHFPEEIAITLQETRPGELLCNRDYLAPEQHVRGATVDRRADIYALGLMLNEFFTGNKPYGEGYKTIASACPEFAFLDSLVSRMIQYDPSARIGDISSVKKELIARNFDFVRQQNLDRLRTQVVSSETANHVLPIEISGLDADRGTLILRLNRKPEDGWTHCFRNLHPAGVTIIGPLTPQHYQFLDQTVRVGVNNELKQEAINHFKKYSRMATEKYQERLDREAKQRDEAIRAEIVKQIELEEQKQRLLSGLTY